MTERTLFHIFVNSNAAAHFASGKLSAPARDVASSSSCYILVQRGRVFGSAATPYVDREYEVLPRSLVFICKCPSHTTPVRDGWRIGGRVTIARRTLARPNF